MADDNTSKSAITTDDAVVSVEPVDAAPIVAGAEEVPQWLKDGEKAAPVAEEASVVEKAPVEPVVEEAAKKDSLDEVPGINLKDGSAEAELKLKEDPVEAPDAEEVPVADEASVAEDVADKAVAKPASDTEKKPGGIVAFFSNLFKGKKKGSDSKLVKDGKEVKMTADEKKNYQSAEKIYQEGLASIRDLIAPSSMEINYDYVRLGETYSQSFYVFSYPRYLETNWLAPVVNFDVTMDISQFIYPINSVEIMKTLRKKVAQMQSAMRMSSEKGQVRDPGLETALEDAESLRTNLQRGEEKFFQFAMYFTIYSESHKKLKKVMKQLESLLGGKLVMTKRAQVQAEQAFVSTMPYCLDELDVIRNMNTSPLSSTFPFTSSDLTSNEGILYGINRHNESLIIFDRFKMENANSVVFAKSGAGKSYAVKLEILRMMMLDTDVIVIDPENEYEELCQTVGGTYLKVSLNSDKRINPFDLPAPIEGEEVQPGDLLRSNVISLQGLLKVMMGEMTPVEEGILDRALIDVYALKGITMDMVDPSSVPPPTMEDLYDILSNMEGATSLAQRIQKFTSGTYAGIFNKPSNVELDKGLMVFSIRDLEDALRPIAMYVILNYIWSKVRSKLKKRMLIIDEAWTLMQHEDSAKFLYGLVKRARKYYLGITTITQDVEDFVKNEYGKPIITNSSIQLLLKQAPASIEVLQKTFNLTEGEKYILLNSGVGQGLFFAGNQHVAIQIIASYTEDKLVTTNPEEILKAREEVLGSDAAAVAPVATVPAAEVVVDAPVVAPPVDTPADAPVAAPPVDTPADAPVAAPPVDTPAAAPVDVPPADTPAAAPVDVPPADTPAA